MKDLMRRLFPICRSITGSGVRETLKILSETIPLEIHEVPSGTKAFDWNVPREWNIRDACVKDSAGSRIIDFQQNNVSVVSYSVPVKKKLSLEELKPHLHTLPNQPDAIPYRTSYYNENWGFCLTHRQFETLVEDEYEAVIDSTLEDGSLTYGEFYLPGKSEDEVLLSTYLCHPSLCNDNLSGVVVTHTLANLLKEKDLNFSYRFIFIPETIGSIVWLSRNEDKTDRIKHGLVVTCVGDRGSMTIKNPGEAMPRSTGLSNTF